MRKIPPSPSSHLATPLTWLKKKPSMVSIHHDLPFGSPPRIRVDTTLLAPLPVTVQSKIQLPRTQQRTHPAVQHPANISSPTAALTKPSKIPSPIYASGTRPRQQRITSESSVTSKTRQHEVSSQDQKRGSNWAGKENRQPGTL